MALLTVTNALVIKTHCNFVLGCIVTFFCASKISPSKVAAGSSAVGFCTFYF